MEFESDKLGEVVVLTSVGRLDSAATQDLQLKVGEVLDGGERLVALDMRRIEHIGGAGLRALLMLDRKLQGLGGGLVLVGVGEALREAFEMAGLTRQFTFVRTVEEAAAKLASKAGGKPAASPVAEVADLASRLLAKAAARGEKKGGGGKA
ncbi:MAG: STAS domain-containing protein [Acidobacteriota bacterium]